MLKRAIRTLWIILDEMDLMWLPVERSWRLNERHYGALQGLNKAQTVEKHGAEQVKIWRRSYDIPPPPLSLDDKRHPRFDRRYADLRPEELPATESLKTTLDRVLPYWNERLAPELKAGRNVLVVAHGNSLRALVKMLDGMSDADIVEFNIPTGVPISLRAGREPEAEIAPLPRRSGSDQGGRGSGCATDGEEVTTSRRVGAKALAPSQRHTLRASRARTQHTNLADAPQPARAARSPLQISVSARTVDSMINVTSKPGSSRHRSTSPFSTISHQTRSP